MEPIRELIAVDLEMTGLQVKTDRILEIGAVRLVDGQLRDTFQTFVNPHRRIDARITELAQQFGVLQAENAEILNYMYMKSVISCATNLHGRTCPLNHGQKRKALREMLEHPRVIQALRELPSQSNRKFLLIAKIFSWRNVTLTYFVTFWATKVMKWAPTAFMKAKHAENLSE